MSSKGSAAASIDAENLHPKPKHCHLNGNGRFDPSPPAECLPRQIVKKDGRVIPLAEICLIKALANNATVLDVRDSNEVEERKGGDLVPTAVHVPINIDGQAQSVRKTTAEEFKQKLLEAGIDVQTHKGPFITHCTGGGRAQSAADLLTHLGLEAYNGGGPNDVREAIEQVRKNQDSIE